MQSKIYQELMDLHLGGMAEQCEAILMLLNKQDVSLNDGIQMLIQAEKERRSASKTVRLIKASVDYVGYGYSEDDSPEGWVDINDPHAYFSETSYPDLYRFIMDNLDKPPSR